VARYRYLAQEAVVGLRRNPLMTIAMVLTVALSLVLLGASLLLGSQVRLAAGDWYGKIEVSIFLCDGRQCEAISPEQREDIRAKLTEDPLVAEVFYESKTEAYERFKEQFSDQPELVASVGPEDLPESFRVKLHDPEQFAAIYDRFSAYPGVEEVVDQREFLKQFFAVTDKMKVASFATALVLLVISSLLITNTIVISAHARREQTGIMKLVGASNWYIRLPFVVEAIFAGVVGALLSWLLLLVAVPAFVRGLAAYIQFMPFIGVGEVVGYGPLLLLAGVVIATVSSLIALQFYLDV